MGIFEFWGQMVSARRLLAARVYYPRQNTPEVYVRLKDGTELPVKAVKVRGGDPQRILLETFTDG